MSYKERLRPSITLTSPDGNIFTALWRGNERTQSKKVGIFDFPNVDGSTVQDLGVSGARYPLTLSFEGPDNDLTATQFFTALKEKGVWQVVHPVHGLLSLQPISFTPNDQPVSSGNITVVDTEWIEPLDLAVIPSPAQLQATVAAQIDTANDTSAGQLDTNTFQDTAEETGAFKSAVNDVVSVVEGQLESISKFSAEITAEMEAIKRDIDAVLAVVPLDVIAVAGQLQQLIQLPALAIEDTQARLDAYGNFATAIGLLSPDTAGTAAFNRVSVQEAAMTAALGAVSDISTTGALLSRTEAVEVIDINLALFNNIVNTLDATQILFEGQPIDKQYFSQSQAYPDAFRLNALTVAYLLRSAFDLKVEKRFVLTVPRNFVMVAMEEYGTPGDNDSNIDLFIDTNKLQGDEFMIMPVGREVVVYI